MAHLTLNLIVLLLPDGAPSAGKFWESIFKFCEPRCTVLVIVTSGLLFGAKPRCATLLCVVIVTFDDLCGPKLLPTIWHTNTQIITRNRLVNFLQYYPNRSGKSCKLPHNKNQKLPKLGKSSPLNWLGFDLEVNTTLGVFIGWILLSPLLPRHGNSSLFIAFIKILLSFCVRFPPGSTLKLS